MPGSRIGGCHRQPYRITPYENAENKAQAYQPTRTSKPYDADTIWRSYDARSPGPIFSTRHAPIVRRGDAAESSYEKVSSWASKCRSQAYTPKPNNFYDHAVYGGSLEDEYQHQQHPYNFV